MELTGRERHFSAEVGSKGRERSSAQRHHHSGRGVAGAKVSGRGRPALATGQLGGEK